MRARMISWGVVLAAAAAFAPPALARPATSDEGLGQVAERLSDPRTQRAMGTAIESMLEALLSMKAAPLAKAAEAMGDRDAARKIDPQATLGDLAGPEARDLPREAARQVPKMMGAMAGMTGAMEAMLPQLRAMGEATGDAISKAAGDAMQGNHPPARD